MACHRCAPELRSVLVSHVNSACSIKASSKWLDERKEHIFVTLRRLHLGDEEIELISNIPVYPHLLVYTFAHVKFCLRNLQFLDAFKAELSGFGTNDNSMKTLLKQSNLRTTLCQFLGLQREPHNDQSCYARENVQLLLEHDIFFTAVQVRSILVDGINRKIFLNLTGSEAQLALNLLQALLDFTKLHDRFRPRMVDALCALSKKNSGLHPECMRLQGLSRRGEYAITGGAWGDIWMGDIHGHVVAIKAMRFWAFPDIMILKIFLKEALLWRQLSHPNVLPF